MIYLITGVPGSGKTLYAVSTLVQDLAKQENLDKDGNLVKRRVLIDGIPDLLLPHELMAERPPENPHVVNSKNEVIPTEAGNGLWNWPDWCKPGDILVVDEVQRFWRPRGMGVKPPLEISALETHRHRGVDFVIITQNPMLLDQNVRRLIGRHQHIRRIFGMNRAMIYDWDGCSVDVHRVKNATKTFWGYPKKAYELYKSSELHTKQKQKIPVWLFLPLIAIVGAFFVAPKAYSVMNGAMSGKGISSAAAPALPSVAAVSVPTIDSDSAAKLAEFEASAGGKKSKPDPEEKDDREAVGCIASPTSGCKCFDAKARPVTAVDSMCPDMTVKKFAPQFNASLVPEMPLPKYETEDDLASFAILKNNRRSY